MDFESGDDLHAQLDSFALQVLEGLRPALIFKVAPASTELRVFLSVGAGEGIPLPTVTVSRQNWPAEKIGAYTMKDLINKAPELIREAAKSTLGLLALVVLTMAILALAFFTGASESVKVAIFALIFVGASLFVISVLRLAAVELTQSTELPIPSSRPNGSGSFDQVAAVCYRLKDTSIELLLVKTDGGRWIFPKGKVSTGEEPWRAAQRKAFEEAGASGEVGHEPLTTFLHIKQGFERTGMELCIAAFPLRVGATQTPAEKGRKPTWFSPAEAEKVVSRNRRFKYAEELKRVIRLASETLK